MVKRMPRGKHLLYWISFRWITSYCWDAKWNYYPNLLGSWLLRIISWPSSTDPLVTDGVPSLHFNYMTNFFMLVPHRIELMLFLSYSLQPLKLSESATALGWWSAQATNTKHHQYFGIWIRLNDHSFFLQKRFLRD